MYTVYPVKQNGHIKVVSHILIWHTCPCHTSATAVEVLAELLLFLVLKGSGPVCNRGQNRLLAWTYSAGVS